MKRIRCECGTWFEVQNRKKNHDHGGCPDCRLKFEAVEGVIHKQNQRPYVVSEFFKVHLPMKLEQ